MIWGRRASISAVLSRSPIGSRHSVANAFDTPRAPPPTWADDSFGKRNAGVGDTGQRVKPLGTRNLFFADLFLPEVFLAYLMTGQSRLMSLVGKISDLPDGRHILSPVRTIWESHDK